MGKTKAKPDNETLTQRLTRLADEEEQRMGSEGDPKLRQTIARTVILLISEFRKAESDERKRIGRLRYEDVLAYIRQLSKDKRAHLLREALEIDEERSMLG